MPTYQYFCAKCEHQFEKVQAITAKTLTICPEELCGLKKWGKGKVKRVISAGAGLIFKGSGFYITDYRSEKYKEAAKKEAGATTATGSEAKSTAGTSSGSESKAAPAKAESTKVKKPKAET
jgi:putative FmdB family regulatory protein